MIDKKLQNPFMLNYLFVVILLEGFIVLACELLAIRQLIPFVGSGTDVVAIIIGAVLMPLSFGYYAGGSFKIKRKKGKPALTVRRKLIWNVLVASFIFLLGLSYPIMILFFDGLKYISIHDELLSTFIYASVFLVYPVFLMGQTIPLVTNFFKFEHLPDITGKILFVSTIGSFCGSIISTIVLMSTIGVHNTVVFVFSLILLIVIILAKKTHRYAYFFAIVIFILAVFLNNNFLMEKLNVVSNNVYGLTQIVMDERGDKTMLINHSESSKKATHYQHTFPYVKYIEETFITPTILDDSIKPLDILVLGAGGFTIGDKDLKNDYVYVDIDKDLKEITEKYLFDSKLKHNKKFIAKGARAFLNQNKDKYDLVIVDLYSNNITIPSHLITKEFYEQVKFHLNDGGMMVANIISSPFFKDKFSRKIDATLRSVFTSINRQIVQGYSPWTVAKDVSVNAIYYYIDEPDVTSVENVYTDNLNTYFLDK